MGLFKRNREKVEELKRKYEINNERHAAVCPEETTTPAKPPIEMVEPQENWIWVEGYKGIDKDMKANYNNFQYELGKQYDHEGKVEICNQGFHFCRDLKDVFNYCDLRNSNRFFKVKALVKESDYNEYGKCMKVSLPWGTTTTLDKRIDKLVAKSIILEEEISKADIIIAYYQYEPYSTRLPEEYWDSMIRNGHRAACEEWQVDNLVKAGYSPVFAKCLYQDDKVKKALAIADQEGVSMDMKVWYIYH